MNANRRFRLAEDRGNFCENSDSYGVQRRSLQHRPAKNQHTGEIRMAGKIKMGLVFTVLASAFAFQASLRAQEPAQQDKMQSDSMKQDGMKQDDKMKQGDTMKKDDKMKQDSMSSDKMSDKKKKSKKDKKKKSDKMDNMKDDKMEDKKNPS